MYETAGAGTITILIQILLPGNNTLLDVASHSTMILVSITWILIALILDVPCGVIVILDVSFEVFTSCFRQSPALGDA